MRRCRRTADAGRCGAAGGAGRAGGAGASRSTSSVLPEWSADADGATDTDGAADADGGGGGGGQGVRHGELLGWWCGREGVTAERGAAGVGGLMLGMVGYRFWSLTATDRSRQMKL